MKYYTIYYAILSAQNRRAEHTKIAKFRSERENVELFINFMQKSPKKFGDIKKMRTFASAFEKNA